MPEESKIGTTVTYSDPDDTRKPVSIAGVTLPPGESVDLSDFMDEGKATRLAEQLAKNPHFQVEGGPDWQQELEERNRKLFEHEQRINEQRRRATKKRTEAEPEEPEPPEGYEAPVSNQLEGAAPRVSEAQARRSRRTQPEE